MMLSKKFAQKRRGGTDEARTVTAARPPGSSMVHRSRRIFCYSYLQFLDVGSGGQLVDGELEKLP